MAAKLAVMGLGNLMRTDDAVGMLVLETLRADPRIASEVQLIEGGTLGLDLLHDLRDITHLIAIDAVDTGAEPGTLSRFEGTQIDGLPLSKSVHLLGFSDLINVLRLMGHAPDHIILLGVQPSITDWGTTLTPQVAAAQEPLIAATLNQLEQWSSAVAEAEPIGQAA